MKLASVQIKADRKLLYRIAFLLAIATILCSVLEGLASTYFGYKDESLTLFGFGADSFVEAISGFGIALMVLRIQRQPDSDRNNFERNALQITGYSFYVLVVGLVITSAYNLWTGHSPNNTISGIVISMISIIAMLTLIYGKTKIGRQLDSDAILADAECTRVCIYMSLVLLVASGINELTRIAYIDSLAALGLAYLSFREGRECFEKARSKKGLNC